MGTKQKQKPALLASIPIPISSRRRTPAPPPSSPTRTHHPSDDLLFAMSPDQNNPFISREQHRLVSPILVQKLQPILPRPADPYSDEPFMYSIPKIKPATPKQRKSIPTTVVMTPKARRHALLKTFNRHSTAYSSSQTSEDESDFDPRHKAHPLTSAFSCSVSTATTSTSSSCSDSFPFDLEEDIIAVPMLSPLMGKPAGLLDQIQNGLPSPSPSPHPDYGEDKMQVLGLEKYFHTSEVKAKPAVGVVQVTRGRPRERRASRGIDLLA